MSSHRILDNATRQELIERAHELRVEKPERMTRAELRDEIIRLTEAEAEQAQQRGLFGVARSMLASVVEAGLKRPDAATVIRGDSSIAPPVRSRAPVATVTLAEIYVAQGHKGRAKKILEQILEQEPDHEEAKRVLDEIRSLRVQSESGADVASAEEAGSSQERPTSLSAPVGSFAEDDNASAEVEGLPVGQLPETVETTGHEIESAEPPAVVEISEESVTSTPELKHSTPKQAPHDAPVQTTPDSQSKADFIIDQSSAFLDLSVPARLYFELAEVSALRFADAGVVKGLCAQFVVISPRLGLPTTEYLTLPLAPAKVGELETLRGVVSLSNELPGLNVRSGVRIRAAVGVELPSGFLPLCVAEVFGSNQGLNETASLQRARNRARAAFKR